ncbi:hypothetical protein BC936DRAFT_141647 [Jimgerdemannia flammicorona]|uniref:HAD-like domain-containing protein n=1 Tax=Jimgerdemannia flammicorona TaxID=994334 RepID=A0A433DFX0_9FUNG|nr:hypothetical protein BC936DRAFT_141647 [Jimgerdemannia flammicorona]
MKRSSSQRIPSLSRILNRRIDDYFQRPAFRKRKLHRLRKHHDVDPADYDRQVDGGLPLEELIKPDPEVRSMLEKLKMKKWTRDCRAMREAGISDMSKCYFVDDSAANVDSGYKLGWTSVPVADVELWTLSDCKGDGATTCLTWVMEE